MSKKIVILGPAHPFRGGGITTFNERLAREFMGMGNEVTIYNFTLLYPSFLFPGKTQYATGPAPEDLTILQRLNSIWPLSWLKTGKEIKALKPDLLVVRYWLPLMGPALGSVLRIVKKNKHTKIVAITDNILPHEKRPGDTAFTKYFLKPCDAFITMSDKVMKDLKQFNVTVPVKKVEHPLYDNFGKAVVKSEARQHLKLDQEDKILLFFGFIRKYKGLDILLDAIKILKDKNFQNDRFKLLVAGEFYDDQNIYLQQIQQLGISDNVVVSSDFIEDNDVKYYFGASDVVIQPYRNATQSGVTPLAYHFEKPMIVTNVGALPDYVPNGKVGLVCEPNAQAIAESVVEYFNQGETHFLPFLQEEKKKYSWQKLAEAIEAIAE
ncbi:glycosyltransferase [Pinibacter aurantiacus]|uniref:Glycosyltransferase n=1 Tax=Pinibacter aurantiacus TaxID=2851599 RepID=A0A9E2SBQ3_9BACT|nr:glycosyltransferase [Pinibacter aurantiacus]MBV4357455.1 glycosyltransferase [Pinibacter aurantiacus]